MNTERIRFKNVPEKIYLIVGDDFGIEQEIDFKELSEITWCADRQYPNDIEFNLSGDADEIIKALSGEPIIDIPVTTSTEYPVSADFMQIRDLTDEEWLKLPKEEILQLYKNCYEMLMQFATSEQRQVTDEEIEKGIREYYNSDFLKFSDATISDFVKGAKWMRDKLTKQ